VKWILQSKEVEQFWEVDSSVERFWAVLVKSTLL